MDLRRGDLIEVQWLDIFEDSVGDPERAELASRVSVGYFWCVKDSHTIPALVTTTTIDVTADGQNGYCIYPLQTVAGIKMIRKGKGKVYREQPSYAWNEHQTDGGKGNGHDRTGDSRKRSREAAIRGDRNVPGDIQAVRQDCEYPTAPARNGGADSNGG